jgi:2-polyprenyl-3-methyl-5-hydroxy-6-metoxy-1,4-benzoquinol methylase
MLKKLKSNKEKITTGTLYGKYSHPFGIIFNRSNIEVRKKTLKNLPFFKKIKPGAKVLELGGTGQDAVAFAELGFETTFIDLSKENIKKTKDFKIKNKKKIKLINSDFIKHKFKENFDVIRSRGVIHHTSDPQKVFIKINKLLKQNGYFHFNLYRSGVLYYWFVEKLREIAKTVDFKKFIKVLSNTKLKKNESQKIGNNKTIKAKSDFYNIIIDDLYVPFLNPANYFDIYKDLKALNFKIINQNKIKDRVNHALLYPDFPLKKEHVVFDVQKKGDYSNKKLFYTMDQYKEGKITKSNPIINENNKIFNSLFKINKKMKLFKKNSFIKDFIILYKDCYLLSVTNKSVEFKHKEIKNKLVKIINRYNY